MNSIRGLRQKKKITQQKLADYLGLARSTIAMYETNKSEPDFETLRRMADYFGVTADEIINPISGDESSMKDFFIRAKIISLLKNTPPLSKLKEKLILQILEDSECIYKSKYELILLLDFITLKQQLELLERAKSMLPKDWDIGENIDNPNPLPNQILVDKGVLSSYGGIVKSNIEKK